MRWNAKLVRVRAQDRLRSVARQIGLACMLAAMALASACSRQLPPTPAGTYLAGDRVVFSNGLSMSVPASGTAYIYTRGAEVTQSPQNATRRISIVVMPEVRIGAFVLGPKAGYKAQLAMVERLYRGSHTPGSRFRGMIRQSFKLDGKTRAIAFVTPGGLGQREVELFITRRGQDPLYIGAVYIDPHPAPFAHARDEDLPRLLLKYVALQVP
jgi:hypothetical protein